MTPQMWFMVFMALLTAFLSWSVYRSNRAIDAKDARIHALEEGFNALRLQVAAQHVRPELEQLREDVKSLSTEFHTLAGAVNRLIGRLDGKA